MSDDQTTDDDQVTGWCMKCKDKCPMVDTTEVKMKNGRPAMKGSCGTCGCGMYKILSTKK
ncbi:MAG: DUF5679 domain-containing protein [Patescibacteria group bacterium]|nr:hypothetical protein [Patescibacteria group bacterium]